MSFELAADSYAKSLGVIADFLRSVGGDANMAPVLVARLVSHDPPILLGYEEEFKNGDESPGSDEPAQDDHLVPEISSRGFKFMDPVPSRYGGAAEVSESSSAMGPHVWLRVKCPKNLIKREGESIEAVWHGPTRDALKISEQLRWLVEHHYQGPPEDDPFEDDESED